MVGLYCQAHLPPPVGAEAEAFLGTHDQPDLLE